MDKKTTMGKITFIHHDKNYATIEYTQNGKAKTINGNIDEKEQLKLKAKKIIKKIHSFNIGDEVSFIITLSARGDKMIADEIQFRFNNALDNILNRAQTENRFVGYLKKVDTDYFVKETGSYILFPLVLSPWEFPPDDNNLNEPIFFKINDPGKVSSPTAALFKSRYIPEYLKAMELYKKKTILNSVVYKVTPHGIFVNVIGEKIQAKIPIEKNAPADSTNISPKPGDTIKILISYLGSSKIIVERA